ncbi:MAG: adenylate kinase [Clostridia bacterium]|nr:adenylate kinase [Clostridia bacterium]
MKLIIVAAPGAGKGTQAEIISKHFGIPTISTGAILRHNIKEGTELGKIAQNYINDGKLVPDDIMIDIVRKRLTEDDCKNGFILDGFPRTLNQAEALDKSDINIDKVLTIEVEEEKIVERLSGRLECSSCGSSFHKIYRTPKVDGVCDNCGGSLRTRKDDQPDVIRDRLETYHKQTAPLKDFYEKKGILCVAEGKESIEDTTAEVLKALEN